MKNNMMVRVMTLLIVMGIVAAHLSGQTNLLSANWLWLALIPAMMGLQATFTGWCSAETLGKLSKTGECCEGGGCDSNATPDPCCSTEEQAACCRDDSEKVVIKVLGTGCANCDNTAKLIQQTAKQLNKDIKLVKVEDIAEIAAYGIMSTPGVVMDETVVHSGGIPSRAQVTEWLNR